MESGEKCNLITKGMLGNKVFSSYFPFKKQMTELGLLKLLIFNKGLIFGALFIAFFQIAIDPVSDLVPANFWGLAVGIAVLLLWSSVNVRRIYKLEKQLEDSWKLQIEKSEKYAEALHQQAILLSQIRSSEYEFGHRIERSIEKAES